jgi:hypothetical protein
LRSKIDACTEQAPSSRSGSNSGEIARGAKGVVAGSAVLEGGEAVTTELEVVVDPAMGTDKKQLR